MDGNPKNFDIEELQENVDGERVFAIAVLKGHPEVRLTMTPNGLF